MNTAEYIKHLKRNKCQLQEPKAQNRKEQHLKELHQDLGKIFQNQMQNTLHIGKGKEPKILLPAAALDFIL